MVFTQPGIVVLRLVKVIGFEMGTGAPGGRMVHFFMPV